MGSKVSILANDRVLLSWLRLSASDTLFFERTYLGRHPIQLHTASLAALRNGAYCFSERREDTFCTFKQHSMLGDSIGVFTLVGGEKYYPCLIPCYSGNGFIIHSLISHLFCHFRNGFVVALNPSVFACSLHHVLLVDLVVEVPLVGFAFLVRHV